MWKATKTATVTATATTINQILIEEIQSASSNSMAELAMNYQPHQPPKTFKFPEIVYCKQERSSQHNYFEKYPWLDYDVKED